MNNIPELYIGLMAGTSLDGIDAALLDFEGGGIRLLGFEYQPFPETLKRSIQELSQQEQAAGLLEYGNLDGRLGELFAETALSLLSKAGVPREQIRAIGSHGQTVFHAPTAEYRFTLQIGDPNRIAQITGITTVADFRRRDMAAGGQGAPLVPAFHRAAFAKIGQTRIVVNIGGIANITVLDGDTVTGFDTGPGNTLMDFWCRKHLNLAYDRNGDWAAQGKTEPALLAALLDDPYFRLPPPKSTGPEYFSPVWLQKKLAEYPAIKTEDVQATLCELTATSIADAIGRHAPVCSLILACGGGTHNGQLMDRLRKVVDCPVKATDEFGLSADHIEACAFAWLARQTLRMLPGNVPSVTGAGQPVILGGIYPAAGRMSHGEGRTATAGGGGSGITDYELGTG